jgi:hypothetical protein
MAMNIYYTAKDIEDLAARGVSQLEVGPNVFLTDFAYETAEQLEIELVWPDDQMSNSPSPPPVNPASPRPAPGRYEKPSGCQHGSIRQSAGSPAGLNTQNSGQQGQSDDGSVNRLVDLMSKIMKRGD